MNQESTADIRLWPRAPVQDSTTRSGINAGPVLVDIALLRWKLSLFQHTFSLMSSSQKKNLQYNIHVVSSKCVE